MRGPTIQLDSPCATILDSTEDFTKLYLFGDALEIQNIFFDRASDIIIVIIIVFCKFCYLRCRRY